MFKNSHQQKFQHGNLEIPGEFSLGPPVVEDIWPALTPMFLPVIAGRIPRPRFYVWKKHWSQGGPYVHNDWRT